MPKLKTMMEKTSPWCPVQQAWLAGEKWRTIFQDIPNEDVCVGGLYLVKRWSAMWIPHRTGGRQQKHIGRRLCCRHWHLQSSTTYALVEWTCVCVNPTKCTHFSSYPLTFVAYPLKVVVGLFQGPLTHFQCGMNANKFVLHKLWHLTFQA